MPNQLHMVTGICYGFEVMQAAESPNTPFTVLYERFETGMYAINPLTTYFYVCMFILMLFIYIQLLMLSYMTMHVISTSTC